MTPDSEEATPISDEELEASAVEELDEKTDPSLPRSSKQSGKAGVSSPPPLPPEARRRHLTPPPPAGRASGPPPAPSLVGKPSSQSGTFRIVPSPPPPGRNTAPPPRGPLPPGEELALLRHEVADARALIARLRLQVRQRDDRILELERACAARTEAEAAATARLEELSRELERARTREVAPPDDLKRIPGIGPAFERALHGLGITCFTQVASWTMDDITDIAAKLRTPPNRIVRDRWVEHARELSGQT